ncbi:hypothetical protein ASPBRDRAFT_135381 [Aspergillus brasiliensis CBS 101740]|uniref:C2H2-type domain-containing protein n=1 Tax=Aspergillus brasiliensis (strain CBS 101740 / IMI 381727 / IBT 21946) TaxID=767769 RepID=A0A1L9U7J5_ASPBC|nr:hypothetical protein ASPBRDRAFT_135381 [Aspergillus brasiliensis CBS 101740]
MDGKDIPRPIGVNPGEDARRHSSISSPDSTATWIATLAIGVPASTRTLVYVDSVKRESTSADGGLLNEAEREPKTLKDESQPCETAKLSSGTGFHLPAAQWTADVQAGEQGHASFATRAQLQGHHIAHPVSYPAPQYWQNCPQAKIVNGSILCRIRRQYQHPRVTDLNLLRDPEPSHVRHSFGEEIKAENGGILLDDILPISPLTPRQCEEEGCGKWFDDDDELCDHEALDHNYPEDCTCRRCLEAFDSRLEKRVHDLYHHSDVLYRERDERSSKGLEN